MRDDKIIIIVLMVISALLGGVGQFLFKYAFLDNMLSMTIAAGLGIYAVSTGIYFYCLSRTHLSWANSISGISYVLAVIFAVTILMEHVSLIRWAGVTIILIGTILVGIS